MALDQSMWQAPALTIAGQAFLLRVLTDGSVAVVARIVILAAGVIASLAAAVALLRLRSREVLYSESVSHWCARLGIRDPRPDGLQRLPLTDPTRRVERIDERLREWSGGWKLPVYWWWIAALLVF
jgi:hypothetical protein